MSDFSSFRGCFLLFHYGSGSDLDGGIRKRETIHHIFSSNFVLFWFAYGVLRYLITLKLLLCLRMFALYTISINSRSKFYCTVKKLKFLLSSKGVAQDLISLLINEIGDKAFISL